MPTPINPDAQRISVACLVLEAFAVLASAQTVYVRSGMDVATISDITPGVWEDSSNKGLNAGLGLVFGRVDLGLSWSQKGTSLTYETQTVAVNVRNLEISSLYRFGVSTEGPLGFHFVVGPTFGYQAQCNTSWTVSGASLDEGDDCADVGLLFRSDWGATGGAGVDIATGSMKLALDLLYYRGFRDISASTTNPTDNFNRSWTVRVGVGFPLR